MSLRLSFLLAPVLIATALAVAPGPAAAKQPADFSIVATEVSTSEKKPGDQAAMLYPLRAAADAEASYYDPTRTPVVMRIRISKLCYKSAGKALADSVPSSAWWPAATAMR